jgi:transcriptional regulator with XRE-family HTH domain
MAQLIQVEAHMTVPATPRAKKLPRGSKEPVPLREVRKDLGLTQTELAELAGMSQGDLSRLERRTDHLISTLQRYVAALGGHLEVAAIFGSRRYPLQLEVGEPEAPAPLELE